MTQPVPSVNPQAPTLTQYFGVEIFDSVFCGQQLFSPQRTFKHHAAFTYHYTAQFDDGFVYRVERTLFCSLALRLFLPQDALAALAGQFDYDRFDYDATAAAATATAA